MGVIDQRLLWSAGCQRTDAGRLRLRRPRNEGSGDGDFEGAQGRKGAEERLLPRPMVRCAQGWRPRAVDEPTRQRHQTRADGPSDGRTVVVVVVEAAQELGPAHQVVGQDGAAEPGAVGSEASRWAVLHPRALLQVADVELCLGALAVEGVDCDGAGGEIGEECEVTPVRPQSGLGPHEPGAPDDEAPSLVGRLCDGGLSAFWVSDWG